ncbi:MAG: hypothetical protein ABI204_06435, partial [Ginsengibacter sp.]
MKQRKPNRLKGYDYSQNNLYFVKSCVKDMICCFGDILVGTGRDLSDKSNNSERTGHDLSLQVPRMILNEYGKIAEQQWYWLAEQYSYIELHEFIVMPNHMHGIIEINGNLNTGTVCNHLDNRGIYVGTGSDLSHENNSVANETNIYPPGNHDSGKKTGRDLSLPKIKSLSELMGAYKMTISKKIHLAGYPEFTWQRSFHDHIIRDEISYEKISLY